MKKLVLSTIALLCAVQISSQVKEMRVIVGGNIAYSQDVTEIDSIIFVDVEPTPIINEDGVLNGIFSVGTNKKIRFTRGNLQYQASTNTFRFAENQYDYVGYSQKGNVYEAETKSSNDKISSSYAGWIDLFGWGTSGYNGCMPYYSAFNTSIYGNSGKNYVDLTGTGYDWGEYCTISNVGNKTGIWHTLTTPEWEYLFNTRANGSYLRGFASIDGNNGYIILPDNWVAISEPLFTPSAGDYNTNSYTLEEWQVLERAGAVFLPAAGFRWEQSTSYSNTDGYYWSATANVAASADRVKLTIDTGIKVDDHAMRNSGQAVRLVQFVNE